MSSNNNRRVQKLTGRARNPLILAAFNDYLISNRSYSPLTLEAYSSELQRFEEFLSAEKRKSLLQAKRKDIRNFLERRRRCGIVERSLARLVSVLRHFYRFLVSGNYSKRNPMARIECPAQPKGMPQTFEKDEIDLVLSGKKPITADAIDQALAARNRAVVGVLYAGGLRVSELLALKPDDVNIQTTPGFVFVQGKGIRNRFCALDDGAASALRDYLAGPRQLLATATSGTALFIGQGGRLLTRQRVWELVRTASVGAGEYMNPRTLRHSRARHLVEDGADLQTVQRLLGYSDVKNARVYALFAKDKRYLYATGRSKRAGDIEQLLLEFAKYLERRAPPLSFFSISAYQSDARLFLASLRRHGARLLPPSPELETAYLDSLRLKQDTVRRKATALKYFREFVSTLPWPPVRTPDTPSAPIQEQTPAALRVGSGTEATLGSLIRQFVAGRPSATARAYSADLRRFLSVCGEDIDSSRSAESAQDFIDNVSESGELKPSSMFRLISTLRSFFHWAYERGCIDRKEVPIFYCPIGWTETIHSPTKVSAEEFERAIKSLRWQPSTRDAAVLHLLREGLTPAEIVALNVANFDPDRKLILVIGRKQRERYIPLSPDAAERVSSLIAQTRTPEEQNVPLIVNVSGARLTTRSVGRIVKRFAEIADLPSHTHPLSIRQSGTRQYRRDPQTLKHRLGLAGAEATSRYLRQK